VLEYQWKVEELINRKRTRAVVTRGGFVGGEDGKHFRGFAKTWRLKKKKSGESSPRSKGGGGELVLVRNTLVIRGQVRRDAGVLCETVVEKAARVARSIDLRRANLKSSAGKEEIGPTSAK